MKPLSWLISALLLATTPLASSAAAPFKAQIANPMTVAIRHSMEQRHSRLVKFYEPGAIGLASDGMVAVVGDISKIKIGTRQIIEKLVDAENDDRRQFLAAVALANQRGNDLSETRAAWLALWRKEMQPGWWLQDDQGQWQRKVP
jgi:hypothetical protein